MARNLVNNFRYGETSQLLAGRIDSEVYAQGASHVENMVCLKQGGMKRRPPLKFLFDLTPYGIKWIKEFTLDAEHSFILLFSNGALYIGEWSKVGSTEGFSLRKSYYYDENESRYVEGVFSLRYADAIDEKLESVSDNIVVNDYSPEKINEITDSEFKELSFAQYYESVYIAHTNHPMLRVDYDKENDTFSLVKPRIIVNQDIDYKLTEEELEKGYKVSHDLGWDSFYDTELNIPPGKDGKYNYPSRVKIIGEQMFLLGTQRHPDYIWKSRSFGSSQIIDANDNHSIQDFVQFQLVETDEQTLKDTADFPKTEQKDENGLPVYKYDDYLNPRFRFPKGIKAEYGSLSSDSTTVEGLVVNGMFVAIKTSTIVDGFPVYIDMNGNRLYNRVLYWTRKNEDGSKTEISYVAGLYQDYNFDNCFMKAVVLDSGKPVTDLDSDSNEDANLDGVQIFESYDIPLYSKYDYVTTEEEQLEHTIVSVWTNSSFADYVYNGITIQCEYVRNTEQHMDAPYQDFWRFIIVRDIDSSSLAFQKDNTTYSVKGWNAERTTKNVSTVPESTNEVVHPSVGDTYTKVETVVDNSILTFEKITYIATGSWVKVGSIDQFLNIGSDPQPLYESLSQISNPSEGMNVWIKAGRGGVLNSVVYFDNYTYRITWTEKSRETIEGTTDYRNASQSKPYPAVNNSEYYIFKLASKDSEEKITATVVVYTYANNKAVTSVLDDSDLPNFPDVNYYEYKGGSMVIDNITTSATSENPVVFTRESNKIKFTYGGVDKITFTKTMMEKADGTFAPIWSADATSFNFLLTNGVFDTLIPQHKENSLVVTGYTVEKTGKVFVEGDAYEDVDLSATSQMTLYNKSLVKTATSSCGMEFQTASGRSDGVKWIECAGGKIIIGTNNSEWTLDYDVNPLGGMSNWYSGYGSDSGFVTTINTDTVFLQRNNILRLFYADRYGLHVIDVSSSAQGITDGNIISMIPKHVPNPHIFLLKDDGTMVSLCIDRDLGMQGWGRMSFGDIKVKSICIGENSVTETLIALVTKIIHGVTHTYICEFDEDFSSDEAKVYKDFGTSMSVTNDLAVDANKVYYVNSSGSYREAVDSDFDITYQDNYKIRSFKSGVTYYEVLVENFKENYTSTVTTNAYEGQLNDGSFTIGMYKSVNRIIIRALDTGRVSVFTSDKTKNRTLYNVSPNKNGLGDFTININGGSAKDTMVTIESVDGDPMTLLALAYDIQVDGDGNKH